MTNDEPNKSALILSGAYDVLLAEGLPHLSYDRIAQTAGVTRQLVRYYFPNSEDLMLALCDHLADTYREALVTSVAQQDDGNRLDLFFDFYFDLLDGTSKPRDDQVYDALFSIAANSDRVRGNLRGQYTLLGQVLAHEVRLQYPDIPGPPVAKSRIYLS
ncbi:MAG: TetR/AcrR family transcriptional regulator [Pseudomonadota bacterium]